jgi:alanine dehydrogenase
MEEMTEQKDKNTGFEALTKATARSLMPKESMLAVETRKKNLFIGLPKESSLQENRIGLTPEAVKQLTDHGHEVWIESGAGAPSKYSDHDYSTPPKKSTTLTSCSRSRRPPLTRWSSSSPVRP